MHSLLDESMPSHEISSRTIVSLTRCFVKNRFVAVAPIVLIFAWSGFTGASPVVSWLKVVRDWFSAWAVTEGFLPSSEAPVLTILPPKPGAAPPVKFGSVCEARTEAALLLRFYLCFDCFSRKRASFSRRSRISCRKLFLWWKMLS